MCEITHPATAYTNEIDFSSSSAAGMMAGGSTAYATSAGSTPAGASGSAGTSTCATSAAGAGSAASASWLARAPPLPSYRYAALHWRIDQSVARHQAYRNDALFANVHDHVIAADEAERERKANLRASSRRRPSGVRRSRADRRRRRRPSQR